MTSFRDIQSKIRSFTHELDLLMGRADGYSRTRNESVRILYAIRS